MGTPLDNDIVYFFDKDITYLSVLIRIQFESLLPAILIIDVRCKVLILICVDVSVFSLTEADQHLVQEQLQILKGKNLIKEMEPGKWVRKVLDEETGRLGVY